MSARDDAPKCTPGCARGETENIWHSQACRDARDEARRCKCGANLTWAEPIHHPDCDEAPGGN